MRTTKLSKTVALAAAIAVSALGAAPLAHAGSIAPGKRPHGVGMPQKRPHGVGLPQNQLEIIAILKREHIIAILKREHIIAILKREHRAAPPSEA
jgi:Spy/CpxP family protein refolding chaperone